MTDTLRTDLLDACGQLYRDVVMTKLSPERVHALEGCTWAVSVELDPLAIEIYATLDDGTRVGVYRGSRERIPKRLVELVQVFLERASVELIKGDALHVLVDSATSTVALFAGESDPAYVIRPPITPKVAQHEGPALH